MMIASSRPTRSAGLIAAALLVAGIGQVCDRRRRRSQPARRSHAAKPRGEDLRHHDRDQHQHDARPGEQGFHRVLSYPSSGINSGRYAAVGNLPALLENLGPSVLRFGGNAVDYAPYTGITAPALAGLAGLATKTGWKVLYSTNLGFFNAANTTADVHNVATSLGTNLFGVACGNEPEDFPGRERPDNTPSRTT